MNRKETMISTIVSSVMFFTTARHAKALGLAYVIREQNLTLTLAADGSANVSDELTYTSYQADTFHHTLHLLDYDVSQLTVSVLDPVTQRKQPLRLTDTKAPLSYQLIAGGDDFQQIQIFYEAPHQDVTFYYDYVIDNFVTNYGDGAELIALQVQAGLIQEDVDFTGKIVLPALTQAEVSLQLLHAGDQAQVVVGWEDQTVIRIGIPAESMTAETILHSQVATELFPMNPNSFPELSLNREEE